MRKGSRSEPGGPVVANYNTPRQTVISGLREALGEAVSRVRGRKVPLNVSFAAHSPYVSAAGEKMREVLDTVEFRVPEVPIISAIDGAVLTSAEAVKEALQNQMVSPVHWVRVVETLARMRVEEWVELGGGRGPHQDAQRLRPSFAHGHNFRGPARSPHPAGSEPHSLARTVENNPLGRQSGGRLLRRTGNSHLRRHGPPASTRSFHGARRDTRSTCGPAPVAPSYARRAAQLMGVTDLIRGCYGKSDAVPVTLDFVVDDQPDFAARYGGFDISPFDGNPRDAELGR